MQIKALTLDAVDQAQRLVIEAGWNQTPQDWLIFLELGQAYQVSTALGEVVATAATLPYRPIRVGLAWYWSVKSTADKALPVLCSAFVFKP